MVGNPVMAAGSTSTLDVKVVLIAPPCEINNNQLIEVNFGNDVLTTRVDGHYKKMPVPYTVLCPDNASNAAMMQIEGNGAVFESEVLLTNITDFGIEIQTQGHRLPINNWVNFSYPNWPPLEAVPVKRPGATLAGGAFSAGATMKVEYQ
ncbi:fimbrial protein [Serratia fonticola]|nr:fimbrial protein [Serratia fonticola]